MFSGGDGGGSGEHGDPTPSDPAGRGSGIVSSGALRGVPVVMGRRQQRAAGGKKPLPRQKLQKPTITIKIVITPD